MDLNVKLSDRSHHTESESVRNSCQSAVARPKKHDLLAAFTAYKKFSSGSPHHVKPSGTFPSLPSQPLSLSLAVNCEGK